MITSRPFFGTPALLFFAASCASNPTSSPSSSVSPGTAVVDAGTNKPPDALADAAQQSPMAARDAAITPPMNGPSMADAGAGCVDDPKTLGNDCAGEVTCSAAVNECSVETQTCCVKDYKPDQVSCNQGGSCDGLARAVCDGPEDCQGAVCCISVTPVPTSVQLRCVADSKACKGGLLVNQELCHTSADCPAGLTCKPIEKLPWWGTCK